MKKLLTLLLLSAVSSFGQLVYTNISVGSSANDGTGDTLRSAFQKINAGFLSVSNNIATNSAAYFDNFSNLSVNGGTVPVGPYDSPATGAANFGASGGETSYEWIALGQKYRVRQNGTVTKARFYNANLTGLTGLYVKVWRRNSSGTYNLVGTSSDILGSTTGGTTSTVTISIPNVEEGDFWGMRATYTSASAQNFVARTGQTAVTNYAVINATPSSTGYAWESQTATAGTVVPVELQMAPPTFVIIGDSIAAGHPAHYSFLETTATTDIDSTIPFHVGKALGATYQNMGIGSQTTANIQARFAADVVALSPRFVILEGGVNDVNNGVATATIQTNWLNMLAACQASNITPVAVLILPWSDGDSTEMGTIDTLNSWLSGVVDDFGGIVVDARSLVGVYRSTGTAGNLWDIQARYNSDNVHFNDHGHEVIAKAIIEALNRTEFDSVRIGAAEVRNRLAVKGEFAIDRPDIGTAGTTTPESTTIYRSNTDNEAHRFTGGTRGQANGLNYYDTTSRSNIVSVFADSSGHGTLDVKNTSGTVNVRLRGQDSTTSYFLRPVSFGASALSGTELINITSSGIPLRLDRSGVESWELHQSAVMGGLYWYNVTDTAYRFGMNESGFVYANTLSIGTNGNNGGPSKLLISNDGYPLKFERGGVESWDILQSATHNGLAFSNSAFGLTMVLKSNATVAATSLSVNDDAYDATAWNGSTNVPTKNAIRDKIESMGGGSFNPSYFTNSLSWQNRSFFDTASSTNIAIDVGSTSGKREVGILAGTSFRFYLTNAIGNTNLATTIYLNVTNSTASAVYATNVVNTLTAIGNWGTIYAGKNTLILTYDGFGWSVSQDTSLIAQSQVENLPEDLNNIRTDLDGRAPIITSLAESTPNTSDSTHFMTWYDSIAASYRKVQVGTLLDLAGPSGSFAYDINVTGNTETNTITSIFTNSVPVNTTREYHATVWASGPTNFVRYSIEAIVANHGGTLSILTNQLSVKESANSTGNATADASFQLVGSDTMIHVVGPTNGENFAWSAKGFYNSRTNHSADGAPTSFAYVLDNITGLSAVGAWSASRKLRSGYAGQAIKVRRSSDDAVADIGFSNNQLDQAALLAHVGAGNGFIRTIYDQSGNGRDLEQSIAGNQPQIVDAGVVLVDSNGKPRVKFDGSDDTLNVVTGAPSANDATYYAVAEVYTSFTTGDTIVQGGSSTRMTLRTHGTGPKFRINSGANLDDTSNRTTGTKYTIRAYFSTTNDESWRVNEEGAQGPGFGGNNSMNGFALGSSTLCPNFWWQELILFTNGSPANPVSGANETIILDNVQAFYLHY